MTSILPAFRGLGFVRLFSEWCLNYNVSTFTSFKRKGPAPHGVEPFSKLFNYFKILRGSGLFIQYELSINRLLFQAFHLLAL